MNDNRVIVLAILLIGVAFFYANLGGISTGEFWRVPPSDNRVLEAGTRFHGGAERQCVVGRTMCNSGGSGAGVASRYGDIVKCIKTPQGGSRWAYESSCNRANPCTETRDGAICRHALAKGLA